MDVNNSVQISLISEESIARTDYENAIFELNKELYDMSSHADKLDYFVAASSGVLCAMLDILWVGEFDLASGREIAAEKSKNLVVKTAKLLGCKDEDLTESVKYLERMFGNPSDSNAPIFGGGLQHHLRDFSHHPSIVGLIFSLLTQFTGMSYGTDTAGKFIVESISSVKAQELIGKDIPSKIWNGTIIWFFHLISDMAGSSNTASLSGGTGIPGPILSLAKELSALPGIRNLTIGDKSLSEFLSKLFNGTAFAKRDENGKIIKDTIVKLDLRGEMGALIELGKQAIPVIANECIVRALYFIRRLLLEIQSNDIGGLSDLSMLSWDKIKPYKNPTLTRMLTVSTGVFTALDVTEAVVTKKYFIAINYVGVGRFAIAIGSEATEFLKLRKVKEIRAVYERIERNTYNETDDRIYGRIEYGMNVEKFGLTIEQTEVLYNLEAQKTMHDINITKSEKTRALKMEWLREWKEFIATGYSDFVNDPDANIKWYSNNEIHKRVMKLSPEKTWLRLVLLEVMLFEPYYTLSFTKDKKGNDVPSKKYKELNGMSGGYKKDDGDKFLEEYFYESFYQRGYIKRLRKCYNKVLKELNETTKKTLISVSVTAAVTIATVLTAGAFAPAIAVTLVGSNFAGLSGAALTSACLAYIGGGAIAAGGLGMAGGTAVIVGGSAVLGLGVGAGLGGAVGGTSMMGKKQTILQSAKLMVSVREIFLNDEHDIDYSNSVYEQYVESIATCEKSLLELTNMAAKVDKAKAKELNKQIKEAEDSIKAMNIAMKSMRRFNSSFSEGERVNNSI